MPPPSLIPRGSVGQAHFYHDPPQLANPVAAVAAAVASASAPADVRDQAARRATEGAAVDLAEIGSVAGEEEEDESVLSTPRSNPYRGLH